MDRKIKLAVVGSATVRRPSSRASSSTRTPVMTRTSPTMHANFGGYHVRDIEIVAAVDVNADKVGKDVAEAIYIAPNNTTVFAQVPATGVTVQKGPRLDGVNKYTAELVPTDEAQEAVDVVAPSGRPVRRSLSTTCRSGRRRRPSSTPTLPSRRAAAS